MVKGEGRKRGRDKRERRYGEWRVRGERGKEQLGVGIGGTRCVVKEEGRERGRNGCGNKRERRCVMEGKKAR